jgi:sRNA-binding carbon storage regulator CsrA
MALVVARKHGEPIRLTTPDGIEIVVTVRAGHQRDEIRVAIEAPRTVAVASRSGSPMPEKSPG